MRLLDLFRNAAKEHRDGVELGDLYKRLQPYIDEAEERRNELCRKAVASAFNPSVADSLGQIGEAAYQLCQRLLVFEGHLHIPTIEIDKPLTMGQT